MIKYILLLLFSLSAFAAPLIDDGSITPIKVSTGVVGAASAQNLGLSVTTSSLQLIVAVKQDSASSDPTARNPVRVPFRSATATSGAYQIQNFVAAQSVTVPTAASLGLTTAVSSQVYIYLTQDTTSEICVSGSVLDDTVVSSSTAITSGATSKTTLYCTAAHTSRPIKYVGNVTATWTNASGWSAITSVERAGSETTVNTDKILNNAITTEKILDSNVTTAKIADGAVTSIKRASLTYAESGNVNISFTLGSNAEVAVSGMSVTVSTIGRPVVVGLKGLGTPATTGVSTGTLEAYDTSYPVATVIWFLKRSTTYLSTYTSQLGMNTGAGAVIKVPCSSVHTIDTTPPGSPGSPSSTTYTLSQQTGSVKNFAVINCSIYAYEL